MDKASLFMDFYIKPPLLRQQEATWQPLKILTMPTNNPMFTSIPTPIPTPTNIPMITDIPGEPAGRMNMNIPIPIRTPTSIPTIIPITRAGAG